MPAVLWFELLILEREEWLLSGAIGGLLLVLVWSAFFPGLSRPSRARVLLWFLYVSGAIGLAAIGPHAAGSILLFAFVVVSALINGRKGAVYSTTLAAGTMVAVGLLHIGGWIDAVATRPVSTPAPWITNFSILVMLSGSVAGSLTFLVSRLESSLTHSSDLIARLQERSSERDQAEADLRASEEHLRTIVDNANDAILTLSSEGVITFTSSSSIRNIGYTAEELQGIGIAELVHPDDLERCTLALSSVVSGAEPKASVSYRVRHKSIGISACVLGQRPIMRCSVKSRGARGGSGTRSSSRRFRHGSSCMRGRTWSCGA